METFFCIKTKVDVLTIAFNHHHYFSLEHYLSNRLREKFTVYQQILSRRQKLNLERRLKVLNETLSELREKLEITVQQKEREFQV